MVTRPGDEATGPAALADEAVSAPEAALAVAPASAGSAVPAGSAALVGMAALRLGLVVCAVIAVPAVALGAALRGGAGAAAALLGIAVVVAFFGMGKLAVARVARTAPHLLLPAALGTYTAQIGLLGMLLIALDGVEAIHLPTLAWTVFVGVFGWIGAELWVATHTRVPFFDPESFAARQAALAANSAAARPAKPGRPAADRPATRQSAAEPSATQQSAGVAPPAVTKRTVAGR